jgi:hypothetical protein
MAQLMRMEMHADGRTEIADNPVGAPRDESVILRAKRSERQE